LSPEQKSTHIAITLKYPVNTLEGVEVLPAGAELTPDLMDEVAEHGKKTEYAMKSLLDHGSVQNDLGLFLKVPPYNKFFTSKKHMQELFDIMAGTLLPSPVLDSFYYFKHHDFYTYQHILVVMAISISIARDHALEPEQLSEVALAGTTHNIGKICVPSNILKKKTSLTKKERDMIDHHMAAGYVLLCHYLGDTQSLAARTARDHHERNDGSGGPSGVCQTDPLVEIVTVSDIYDALISPRAYRPVSFDNRSAIEILTNMAESGKIQWEPVKAIVARNRSPYVPYNETVISNDKRGTTPPGNIYDTIADK
jgi:HD-GYP domain-containing protein (c-di-GMP phosphodiesterase class II)